MNPGFEVTLKDVYDEQRSQAGRIDVIGQQLAVHTATVAARLDSGQARMTDFERRIRSLEAFRWKLAGIATLAGIVAAAVAEYLAHH